MIKSPSIERVLAGLNTPYQDYINGQYERILPILLKLLKPHAIWERNRTWPGVSPNGKQATRLLLAKNASKLRQAIRTQIEGSDESEDELWELIRSYCLHGPIGLIDALDHPLEPLVPDELGELARFHRLGKHPRSDAGIYIRELLSMYAQQLGYAQLPNFVARYAFASNRKLKNWFFGDSQQTEHVPRTTRRINRNIPYPHQRWHIHAQQLRLECRLAERHPDSIQPWLLWINEPYTNTLQGIRLCAFEPGFQDSMVAFRWAIWHFNAAWWGSRGIPDTLAIPYLIQQSDPALCEALRYTQTNLIEQDAGQKSLSPNLPFHIAEWQEGRLQHQQEIKSKDELPTLQQITQQLLGAFQDVQVTTKTAAAPTVLAEQHVSLPWSTGIAAAYLLPSGGQQRVNGGQIALWGVPYDVTTSGLADGMEVEIRYDPDDARAIFLVYSGGHIVKAPACAFEGAQVSWLELVGDPEQLRMR